MTTRMLTVGATDICPLLDTRETGCKWSARTCRTSICS